MRQSEYEKMDRFEKTYWWHVGRKYIINNQLEKYFGATRDLKILNIGCGTGGTISLLEGFGDVKNLDVSESAVNIAKCNGHRDVYLFNGEDIPFKKGSFDLIVALDVLEHIENDIKALELWREYLKPTGHLLMTVPAYQWLWSGHDEALHHFRRYSASGVQRLLNISGYKAIKRTYAIVFSFPLVVIYRFISSILPTKGETASYVLLPRPLNSMFVFY